MPTKRGKGSVRKGETGKKAKTALDAGGKSVSEKSQPTHTSKNPFEIIRQHTECFVGSHTSIDVDPSFVSGETELRNAYVRVQQLSNDTDPLMWWKYHQQEFPRLVRIVRQYLTVPASPASSVSPDRLFNSVGFVKSDLWGGLLDTTLIDVMWAKQAP